MHGRNVRASRRSPGSGPIRIIGALLVACAGFVVNAGPAGATPVFSIIPSPARPGPPTAELEAASCPSATTCLTVGRSRNALGDGPRVLYAERWDGTTRRRVPIQTPAGFSDGLFSSIACAGDTNCVAVGGSGPGPDSPLVERWNGTAWTVDAVPVPAATTRAWLTGVSCPSATLCLATGNDVTAASDPAVADSFVDQWDGSSWTLTSSAAPTGATSVELRAISCATTTSCVAVGTYATATVSARTLTERWNGTVWIVSASPNPFPPSAVAIVAVDCAATTSCIALGSSTPASSARPFSLRWNGSTWSLLATATPPTALNDNGSTLSSVSCAAPSDCDAVGQFSSDVSGSRSWTQHFDGSAWTNVTGPPPGVPPSAASGALESVSCFAAATCLAVGSYDVVGSFDPLTLAERFDGTTWAIVPPNGASQSELSAIDCPSPTLCFTVGSGVVRNTNTLIGRWNGTTWAAGPTPNPGGATRNELRTIACASATSCFAVGSSIFAGMEKSLIERWDGAEWSLATIPNPAGATGAGLSSISCPTATRCLAIGFSSKGELTAQWNGTTWTVATDDVSGGGSLEGLSCPTATSCFAVGSLDFNTLVRHWDGTAWSTIASPNGPSALFSDLSSVSCSSTVGCVAVGAWESPATFGPLVERWDGAAWTTMTTPAPAGLHVNLLGVSCPSDTSCEAVGTYSSGGTLAETMSGSSWTIVPTANRPGAVSSLSGVSCVTTTNCFAVGHAETDLDRFTLVEQYH